MVEILRSPGIVSLGVAKCTLRLARPFAARQSLNKLVPKVHHSISGLVAEYIVAIDVTRVRFLADAFVTIHFI